MCDVELGAVCDENAEAAERVAGELGAAERYTDFREAVASDRIDAVVIVTPTFTHREIACAAAQAGKHVFLEKPMAINAEECEAIMAAARAADVRLQLGFMRRFDADFVAARELLADGRLGRVMTVKSIGRGPGLPPPWILDVRKSNGVLAEVNSHDFDSPSVGWPGARSFGSMPRPAISSALTPVPNSPRSTTTRPWSCDLTTGPSGRWTAPAPATMGTTPASRCSARTA
jgi:hypothetical protein